MAKDLRELMRALDIPQIALVGHDRGARVATRFAKDHPEALDRLVVMDNVPTRIVARDFNPIMAKLTGVSELLLDHYELGKNEIALDEMLKIACALGVPITELMA